MADLINYSIELNKEEFKQLQKQILLIDDYLIKSCGSNYIEKFELFREHFLLMAKQDLTFIQYLKN
jgi:hypothetical protein